MEIDDQADPANQPLDQDIELDASEDRSMEMLGRVYSQAMDRRQRESLENKPSESASATPDSPEVAVEGRPDDANDDDCPVNPRSILEAMLFVGLRESGVAPRHAASLIRGVSPQEVERLVDEINDSHAADESAFRIRRDTDGLRLVLAAELEPIREHFLGRIREARLGGAAIEVLAIVAYHQPVTLDEVDRLRNRQSGPVLNLLVRRELLQVERDSQNRRVRRYRTTARFLSLFGMESIEDLPQAQTPQGTDFLDE